MIVATPIAECGFSIAHYKAEVNTRKSEGYPRVYYTPLDLPFFTAESAEHAEKDKQLLSLRTLRALR